MILSWHLQTHVSHCQLQASKGEVFAIKSNNDKPTTVRIFHPENLIFSIFDLQPNHLLEPLVVNTNSATTNMYLDMQASEEEWTTESQLASNVIQF